MQSTQRWFGPVSSFGAGLTDVTIDSPCSADPELVNAQTIARMCALVGRAQSSPGVMAATRAAIAGAADSPRAVCDAVFRWIKSHVEFVEDETLLAELGQRDAKQLLIAPWALLAMPRPRGACASFSTLCASMLELVGVPCEFCTVAADRITPDRWSHVYVYALIDGGRLALDTSHAPGPGLEAAAVYRRAVWPILSAPATRAQLAGPRLSGLPPGYALERSVLYGPRPKPRAARGLGSDDGGGIDWTEIITSSISGATSILKPILTPAGTYSQTGPGGTVNYRAPAGASGVLTPLSLGSGSISSSTLLLAGGALLALVLIMGGRR